MNYLITGATGTIGSRVVDRLLQAGQRPRIFVRNSQQAQERFGDRVDIVVGDLAGPESLAAALDGIDAVFLVSTGPGLEGLDEAAARISHARGVRKLVKLSSMDARQDVGSGVFHARGEAAIRACGIGYVFVQPAGFMTNALGWATSIRAEGIVRSCTGDGRIAFIHPDDIADVATMALTASSWDGQSLPVTGPQALSFAEMTAMIAAAIGRPLSFQPVSEDEARQRWIARGEDPYWVDTVDVPIWRAVRRGRLAEVTDTVQRVTGRSPKRFDQWAKEVAEAFL
jgi:uncharacterized protein YbjT (DUF2867 family)